MGQKLSRGYGLRPEIHVVGQDATPPVSLANGHQVPAVQADTPLLVPPVGELLDALLGDNAVRDRNVLQLLESSNPNLTLDKSGLKPIHVATIHKNLELLQKVLSNRETDVNSRASGLTALHFAAQVLSVEVVKELLKQPNILVNALTTQEKQTALMVAIATDAVKSTEEEKAAVVKCLVEDTRCELDKTDGDGWIALTYAAKYGNIPVGNILLGEQRTMLYTVDQLVNAYRQALFGGHEVFCELLMSSLTHSQKEHIRGLVIKLKEMSGTTPFLRDLLQQASNILDNGYVEAAQSGPAWDRHDQLLGAGSVVQLMNDKGVVRALQRNIGTHMDSLDNVIGQCGIIKFINLEGVLSVDFSYFGSQHKRIRYVNRQVVSRLSQDEYVGVGADEVPIHAGDTVRLTSYASVLEKLTLATSAKNVAFHAGFPGILKYFNQSCEPVVFLAGTAWTVGALALTKVTTVPVSNGQLVTVGDTVEITASRPLLERLQTPIYGGWNPAMVQALGKTGTVTHIGCECFIAGEVPDCNITFKTGKSEFILNPKAVVRITEKRSSSLLASPANSPVVLRNPATPSQPANRDAKFFATDELPVAAKSAELPVPESNNVSQKGNLDRLSESQGKKKFESVSPSGSLKGTILHLRREPSPDLPPAASPTPNKEAPSKPPLNSSKGTAFKNSKRFIPYGELTFMERIGKGGFGTVYRAKWHGSQCAVKVLKCDDSDTGQDPSNVLDEAECHGSVSHPHIVQFLGVSFNDADQLNLNAYIVMKFVDGYDLYQCTFGFKLHLTAAEKIAIARQICDAIRYLHDNAKIIHQDIKPHNILIDKHTREAMVTDFGISKIFSDPPLDVSMAMYTPTACGSLPYMAPELVILSKRKSMYRKATETSDIWSLGATLTEMFTGRPLYGIINGLDLHTLMNLKASADPPAAIATAAPAVKAVLESSLKTSPSERPRNCKELLRLLDEHTADLQSHVVDSEV